MQRLDLKNSFGNSPILFIKRTTSTMNEARTLAETGCGHGTVILAGYQSAGRGRTGERRWISSPGDNLLCTIIFQTNLLQSSFSQLPLRFGVAVSKALANLFGLQVKIKWPNDVLVNHQKIAGVLCEATPAFVFAGLGVNCNQPKFVLPAEKPAVSIGELIESNVEIHKLLENLLTYIKESIDDNNWRAYLNERLYGKGRMVHVTGTDDKKKQGWRGIITEIGTEGQLVLLSAGTAERRELFGGEITFLDDRD